MLGCTDCMTSTGDWTWIFLVGFLVVFLIALALLRAGGKL